MSDDTSQPPPRLPRTLSINQACAYAGVSRRTIYNWMAAGKLTRLETPGGSARFYAHELVRDPSESRQPELPPYHLGGLCFQRHPETGARCELPLDHTENHKGEFAHGVAQWPR